MKKTKMECILVTNATDSYDDVLSKTLKILNFGVRIEMSVTEGIAGGK